MDTKDTMFHAVTIGSKDTLLHAISIDTQT